MQKNIQFGTSPLFCQPFFYAYTQKASCHRVVKMPVLVNIHVKSCLCFKWI